ncbi:hypothetical protein AVEN_183691-1, partial [Araneus ventricosus]
GVIRSCIATQAEKYPALTCTAYPLPGLQTTSTCTSLFTSGTHGRASPKKGKEILPLSFRERSRRYVYTFSPRMAASERRNRWSLGPSLMSAPRWHRHAALTTLLSAAHDDELHGHLRPRRAA